MAITILPKDEGFGGRLGTALGTGLGDVLGGLVSGKAKAMQAQQFQQAGLPGVLAHLDPQVQAAYLKQYGAAQQMAQQREQLENINKHILELGVDTPQEVGIPTNALDLLQMQNVETQPVSENNVPPFLARPTKTETTIQDGTIAFQPKSEPDLSSINVPISPGARGAIEMERFERKLSDPSISATQKAAIREQIEKRQERFNKEQDTIDKSNSKYYQKIMEQRESAETGDARLGRMETLINKGDLPFSTTASFLSTLEKGVFGLGLNLKGLIYSDDAQEFDKLSKDFTKDAQKFFPRLTEGEVKLFLEMIPSLLQSDSGKLRVLNNMRFFNKAVKLKYNATQDIIEANRGYQPKNLESLVRKRTQKEVDEIYKSLREGIKDDADFLKTNI